MGVKPVDWAGALTLGELIYKMVREKKTKSPEFEALIKHYGEKRLRELYVKQREIEKEKDK